MKNFTKILSLFLALTMLLCFPVAVSAAELEDAPIDESRTGSLTIYKYDLRKNSCSGSPGQMPITRRLTMPIPTFIGILLVWIPSGTTLATSVLPRKCCFTKQSVTNRFRKQWSWFR